MFRTTKRETLVGNYKMGTALSSPSAGVAIGFVPTSVTGLIAWYSADSITGVTTDNTGVSSWTDRTGFGRNATQATSGSQPTYKTNRLNGKPVVRFNPSGNFLQITSASFSGGATFFLVCSASSATLSGNNGILCAASSGNDYDTGESFLMTVGYTGPNNPSGFNPGWRGVGGVNVTTVFRAWYYWTYHVAPSGANVVQKLRRSGTEIDSRTNAASSNASPTKMTIGGRIGGGNFTSPYYQGDIAEILVYNNDIGASNITLVENYIKDKYAL